jgi:TolB-like protein/class 3 adenylate cyclase/thioredoxin-like negative regulator of GroEL
LNLDEQGTIVSEGERRLAAIMFTDMVGYTALTQSNEAQAMEVLDRHNRLLRPFFPRFHGREVKAIGDSFLVEFESALDALKCATEIQSYLHDYNVSSKEEWKIKLRIGIHLGDVIHQGGDVYGDAVNIASRIYPLAEPEGVCVSDQVFGQVRNKVSYPLEKMAPQTLKNVQFPIDVYRVIMPWEHRFITKEEAPTLPRDRIAILPFANMSPDPNDGYFADGMTEELISTTSSIAGLTLIARTSVMGYKGTTKKVEEIGKELSVGTVLEGSVRKSGNRLRITAQLIDVQSQGHLWAQSYDRELDDILKIQDDIAGKIAEALRVRLATTQEPVRKQAESIEAYTLYLKGRSLWNKRDKEGILGAIKSFQEAIRIDPTYAKAYSGLADAYSLAAAGGWCYNFGYDYITDPREGLSKAKEALTRALELDDALPEAHASLGHLVFDDYRFQEAQRELRRAIELNPSYASAHHWYSLCLMEFGNLSDAIDEMERAHVLDPLSPIITLHLAYDYLLSGRTEEALAMTDRLLERMPTLHEGYVTRWMLFVARGMKDEAFADLETIHKLYPNEELYKLLLAELYGLFGEREKGLNLVQEVLRETHDAPKSSYAVAETYAVLGEADECFKWAERAIEKKQLFTMLLRYGLWYDKVRNDPRFPEIFKRLGLPYQPNPK